MRDSARQPASPAMHMMPSTNICSAFTSCSELFPYLDPKDA